MLTSEESHKLDQGWLSLDFYHLNHEKSFKPQDIFNLKLNEFNKFDENNFLSSNMLIIITCIIIMSQLCLFISKKILLAWYFILSYFILKYVSKDFNYVFLLIHIFYILFKKNVAKKKKGGKIFFTFFNKSKQFIINSIYYTT